MFEPEYIWKEHKVNNIQTNPLDYWYCTIDNGKHVRQYRIEPQYPSYDGVCVNSNLDPELYIFFEVRGRRATEKDMNHPFFDYCDHDGYVFEHPSFIRAFRTLEEAKARAKVQYDAIFKYVASFIPGCNKD